MISNYVIETRINEIKADRLILTEKKRDLQASISSLGVSANQAYKRPSTIPEETFLLRDNWVSETLKLDKEIIKLNDLLRPLYREKESEKNKQLMNIFKEIFSQEQIIEIREETERRMRGELLLPISFTIRDSLQHTEDMKRYKKVAQEQLDKMQEFRLTLTKVIEKGCDKFDPTEFMRVISPLNRLIIPIQQISKLKVKHFLSK